MQCRWRSVPVASSARAQAGRVGDACRGRARCAERAALVRCGVRGTRGEHLCVKVAPTVSKGPRRPGNSRAHGFSWFEYPD